MITLEDILEEFLGDIQDEYDRLPPHLVKSGNAWIVGGGTPLVALQGDRGHRFSERFASERRREPKRLADRSPRPGSATGRRTRAERPASRRPEGAAPQTPRGPDKSRSDSGPSVAGRCCAAIPLPPLPISADRSHDIVNHSRNHRFCCSWSFSVDSASRGSMNAALSFALVATSACVVPAYIGSFHWESSVQ